MTLRRPIIDPKLSDGEKIKKLSKAVEHLGRRAVKHTSAIISPIPISNCISADEVKGNVLKYLFPCPGIIDKCGISLNIKPKNGGAIVLTIENELGSVSRSYTISNKSSIFEPKIEISTWDRLTVSFYTIIPDEDKVSEVWVALLWTPTMKDVTVKNYLIDDLDGGIDEGV